MIEAKDLMGKPISIGDIIVYPVRQSSSMWMSKAIVCDIIGYTPCYRKEPVCALDVLVVSRQWKYDRKAKTTETIWKLVKGTVYRLDRVTVVPAPWHKEEKDEGQKLLINKRQEMLYGVTNEIQETSQG